mgnify:CR=1 FL=1
MANTPREVYIADWEAKLPEFKDLFNGAEIAWRGIERGRLVFEVRNMDHDKEAKVGDLVKDILAGVNYSDDFDAFSEIDYIEQTLSETILSAAGIDNPTGPFAWAEIQSQLRYGFIRFIMDLHDQTSSPEISDVSASVRADLKV